MAMKWNICLVCKLKRWFVIAFLFYGFFFLWSHVSFNWQCKRTHNTRVRAHLRNENSKRKKNKTILDRLQLRISIYSFVDRPWNTQHLHIHYGIHKYTHMVRRLMFLLSKLKSIKWQNCHVFYHSYNNPQTLRSWDNRHSTTHITTHPSYAQIHETHKIIVILNLDLCYARNR